MVAAPVVVSEQAMQAAERRAGLARGVGRTVVARPLHEAEHLVDATAEAQHPVAARPRGDQPRHRVAERLEANLELVRERDAIRVLADFDLGMGQGKHLAEQVGDGGSLSGRPKTLGNPAF